MSDYKTYLSINTAQIGVDKAGLGQMFVRFDRAKGSGRILPVILCDTPEDAKECRDRGFAAEIKYRIFSEGATVRLKEAVLASSHDELAIIESFIEDSPLGVVLDRPMGGTRWWAIEDLELLEWGNDHD